MTKSQSAMEYLMTYGWSILIIAVVLGALSFLGVFNPMTFTPKATAGGCQVIKNTQIGISNLEGACNNQVPQYVAQFNGQTSNVIVSIGNIPSITSSGSSGITITAWASLIPSGGNQVLFSYTPQAYYPNIMLFSDAFCPSPPAILPIYHGSSSYYKDACLSSITPNVMDFYALTFNGSELVGYEISGGTEVSHNVSVSMGTNSIPGNSDLYIGGGPGASGWQGNIANIQVYNTSLSSQAIYSLYQEGIGGVPVDINNLVSWLPLNGNANDYSGTLNNGVPSNIVFTSNWYNGYTQP